MVIPTYWSIPGIILNDETYLFGQVSLFFTCTRILLGGKPMGIGKLIVISIGVSMAPLPSQSARAFPWSR